MGFGFFRACLALSFSALIDVSPSFRAQAMKAERLAQQKKEEEAFRQMMMKKFEEDAQLERMNAQKARMAREAYRREVDKLIEVRKAVLLCLDLVIPACISPLVDYC